MAVEFPRYKVFGPIVDPSSGRPIPNAKVVFNADPKVRLMRTSDLLGVPLTVETKTDKQGYLETYLAQSYGADNVEPQGWVWTATVFIPNTSRRFILRFPVTGPTNLVQLPEIPENLDNAIQEYLDLREEIKNFKNTIRNGASAYDLAIQQGFVGSLDDWLASLKGPKGDEGNVVSSNTSSNELIGPGRPDIPSTTGQSGKVNLADVGTSYISIDGAGVGAWTWLRRPAGWVISNGDTGFRVFTNVPTGNKFYLRRSNNTVFTALELDVDFNTTTVFPSIVPKGFQAYKPRSWNNRFVIGAPGWSAYVDILTGDLKFNSYQPGLDSVSGIRSTSTHSTDDPWPIVLPGNPV